MFNPVNWFEIPVENLERAKKFYENVFGVALIPLEAGPMKMLQFPMDQTSYGSAGTLVKMDCYKPSTEGILIYFSVTDIAATLNRITAHGGSILLPETSIGEYGFIAQFTDCEGNRIALHKMGGND